MIKLRATRDAVKLSDLDTNELVKIYNKFGPIFEKSGHFILDARAMLDASVKFGVAQSVIDNIVDSAKNLHIRPFENSDFNQNDGFQYNDKVIIIFGVEDETKKEDEYPIKRIYINRGHVKVIDIVDVQDLYHTNVISFTTPVLYRKNDACSISVDENKAIPFTLKFLGLVFFK